MENECAMVEVGDFDGEVTTIAELQADFALFMQKMLDNPKQTARLSQDLVFKDAFKDPLSIADSALQREQGQKRDAAKARAEAAAKAEEEALWRKTVRLNQAQRLAAEEQQRLEAERRAAAESPPTEPEVSPMSQARMLWRIRDAKRVKEAAEKAAAWNDSLAKVNDAEWQPRLEQHKQALRAQRAAEQQQLKAYSQAEADRLHRETSAMESEDYSMKRFLENVAGCCQRIEAGGVSEQGLQCALAILDARATEAQQLAEKQEEEEKLRRSLAEMEYRAWRREVAVHGESSNTGEPNMLQASSPVAALEKAANRQALQRAREIAEAQQRRKAREAPAKAEQDLWEAMLARNRLKQKQERQGQATPRWGLLNS